VTKISAVVPDELGAGLNEVRDDDPNLAIYLRIEERELEADGELAPHESAAASFEQPSLEA
jgi:hypothetical protein